MKKFLRVADGKKLVSGWEIDISRKDFSESETYFSNTIADKTIEWLFLPDSVEVIGDKAFEHCTNLKTVYLSANLKHIGFNGFWGCEIENTYYPGSIFAYEKIQAGEGGKPVFHYLHCADGTFDFTKEKYIDVFPFKGTVEEWKNGYKGHWLNRRANNIVCTDGIIEI